MGITIRNTGNSQGGVMRFTSLGLGGSLTSTVNPITTTTTTTTAGLFLLDSYSGGSAAYSLRKLRAAYTGSAIRVRRASDNSEQDIGFVNNQLDTASLLSFAGSQNLALYSEQFDQPSWTKGSVTVTSNQGTAPNGTTTADKLVLLNNAEDKLLYQTVILATAPIQTTFSIYAKASGYNYIFILLTSGNTPRYGFNVDLTNGSITKSGSIATPTNTAQSVTSVGNGWYRISVTMDSGGTSYCGVAPTTTSNPTLSPTWLNPTDAGNGTDGVLIWGAQLSYGTLTTTEPYQVTTTAAANSGFVTTWYDQSGNGRNAIQGTATNQPRIVCSPYVSGSLDNSFILFDGIDDKLTISYDLNSPFSIFSVQRITTLPNNANGSAFIGNLQNGGNYDGFSNGLSMHTNYSIAANVRINGIGYNTTYIDVGKNKTLQSTFITNSLSTHINGGVASTVNNTYSSHDTQIAIGAARTGESTAYMRGYYGYEVIFYPSNQSSSRVGIETNINSNYSIY